MFGHLKPEEFVHLIEGGTVSAEKRQHIESCGQCAESWKALQSVHSSMADIDEGIPEPEWSEFRSSVRDEILSRSVRREAASAHRWSFLTLRPGLSWALSIMFVAGVTVSLFMLRERPAEVPLSAVEEPAGATAVTAAVDPDPLIEVQDVETEMAMWTNGSVFEDISALESAEAESLRQLLEMEGNGAVQTQ